MFKVTDELVPKSIHQLFSKNKDIHSHDTRNKDLLRASTGTKKITFLSSRKWNAIVRNINIHELKCDLFGAFCKLIIL